MWLLFDIGNTRLKWRWADAATLVDGGSEPLPAMGDELSALVRSVRDDFVPENIVISNVAGSRFERALADWSYEIWRIRPTIVRPADRGFGIVNGYDKPGTLGVDRWCGLIGARMRFPGALCVVDCGTAVTVDLLSHSGNHMGGLIIPGIHAMIRALTSSTNGIRSDSEVKAIRRGLGQNTSNCISAGVVTAISGSIDVAVNRLSNDERPAIVLTGGDAEVIAAALACPAHVELDLVFHGLAEIARGL